jgi:membrane protease YdiL (CAAX protease family)
MSVATGGAAAAAVATRRVALSPNVTPLWAVLWGAASGVALYAATVGFVMAVRRWPPFRRHVEDVYDLRRGLSRWAALLLAAGVVSSAEEIFWRGLFQERVAASLGDVTGAVLSWLAYVAANLPSASLPILAGATVSGAAWGGLALWTGGVLASVVCHSVWTGLMVAFPPGSRRKGLSRTRARAAS